MELLSELDPEPLSGLELIEPDPQVFMGAVKRIQEYIREGDIYQANLSRKYLIRSKNSIDLLSLAKRMHNALQQSQAAAFSELVLDERHIIICASPECFLEIHREAPGIYKLSTSPIKGTAAIGAELSSSKNQAEHIMIVDVERNDLSKIAKTASVKVERLMSPERFHNLEHLVSTISAYLDESYLLDGQINLKSILSALFPSGSITGAPKLRAMQIIQELEPCPRGPYTGVLGYYDPQCGYGKWCILIRSIVIDRQLGEISFHVGAGITAGSDPLEELTETRLKAAKIIEALQCKS